MKQALIEFTNKGKKFVLQGVSETDHIYQQIVKKMSFYEIDLLDYIYGIRRYVSKPNSVAIDVGANIGNHSVFLQSFVTEHLLAVEPNPAVLPVLRRNLENNITNYCVYEKALGEKESLGRVVLPEAATQNIGVASVDVSADEGSNVHVTTLDSLYSEWCEGQNGKRIVSLVKIDVEGMELMVLKGACNTLVSNTPHLFVEAMTSSEYATTKAYLKGLGYKVVCKWARTPVYHFAFHPPIGLRLLAAKLKILHYSSKLKRKIIRCLWL